MPHLPNRAIAHISREDGRAFDAEVRNLTTASVFLVTAEGLAFREKVSLSMFGLWTQGEVALTIAGPIAGSLIVFQAPPAVRESIALHLHETGVIEPQPQPLVAPDVPRNDPITDPVPAIRATIGSDSADSLDAETIEDLKLDIDTLREPSQPIAVASPEETPTPEGVPPISTAASTSTADLYRRPPLVKKARPPKP
jgi:hypothetical protein